MPRIKSMMKPKESEQVKTAAMPKSLSEIVIARRKAVQDYSRLFLSTFGVQLGRYMHPIFGFDVVRFDGEIIQPKDGESTKDVVEREYGKEAVDLILKLLRA